MAVASQVRANEGLGAVAVDVAMDCVRHSRGLLEEILLLRAVSFPHIRVANVWGTRCRGYAMCGPPVPPVYSPDDAEAAI